MDIGLLRALATEIRAAFGTAGASLTILQGARPALRSCVPDELEVLERVQERHGDGPVPEAIATGRPVAAADLDGVEQRWPDFARIAAAVGIRSSLAVPLLVDGVPMGALAMYATAPHAFDTEIGPATLVGALVAEVVASNRARQAQERRAGQLQTALDSRVELEQAKGMLAAGRGIEVETAFELIRSAARRHNRTIASVAREIVESGQPAIRDGVLGADDTGRS